MIIKYELYIKQYREEIDLVDFEKEIIAAIHAVCPEMTAEVHSKYYQLSSEPTRGEAIQIGKQISCTIPELHKVVREYGSKGNKDSFSRKLFHRMKEGK